MLPLVYCHSIKTMIILLNIIVWSTFSILMKDVYRIERLNGIFYHHSPVVNFVIRDIIDYYT